MNLTENITIFKPSEKGKLKDNLTSSLFPTFITEVGLYDDNQDLMGYVGYQNQFQNLHQFR